MRLASVAEIFTDRWVDVTTDVRHIGTTYAVTRDRTGEDSETPASTCALKLDNRAGLYSPRNPNCTNYGLIGRNTPLRVGLVEVTDTFSRTAATGWGSADTGQAWSGFGGGGTVQISDFAVGSGVGTQSVPVAAAFRYMATTTDTYRNIDVAVTVTLPFTNVTGAQVEPANILLRGSGSTYYMVRVAISTAEAVTIALHHSDGTVLAGPVSTGITHSTSQALRVRAQIEEETLRAKVWVASQGEPYDWQVSVQDTRITTAGWIGVRSGVASGNTNTTPVVFSYDSLSVSDPWYAGEVIAWPQRQDHAGNDRWVDLKAAGVLRRLAQGNAPEQSAIRAYLPTTSPLAYWPLEERELAARAEPVAGPYSMSVTSTLAPGAHFGQGVLAPWLLPGFGFKAQGSIAARLTGVVQMPSFVTTTGWCVDHVRTGGRGGNSLLRVYDTSGLPVWSVSFDPTNVRISVQDPLSGFTDIPAAIFDDAVHHIRFRAVQSGANIAITVSVDGVVAGTGSAPATTLTAVTAVEFVDSVTHTEPLAIGHVAVWDNAGPTLADAAGAAFGYDGESAGERIQRLCATYGIPFVHTGDLGVTETMGAQRIEPLLDLIRECVRADMGVPYEPRGIIGLGYRTLTSIYNQAAAVTLDWARLTQPPRPTDDDLYTRNDITVTREDGGTYRTTQTTGTMSTADPSTGGAGRYTDSKTFAVSTDDQLPHLGGWLLHLGTIDEQRYESLETILVSPSVVADTALLRGLKDLRVMDRVALTSVPDSTTSGQVLIGCTEKWSPIQHMVELRCAPESAYRVFTVGDATLGRLHFDGQTLAAGATTTATTLSVATAAGKALVTTAGGDMPIPITIEGEQMSVTAVSGASSPQTFTVTRSVNGVVNAPAAGAPVELTSRHVLAK